MTALLNKKVAAVWVFLVAVTLFSLAMSTSQHISDPGEVTGMLILLLAFVKVWLVGMYFMELRGAPRLLRALFNGWCVAVGVGVVSLLALG